MPENANQQPATRLGEELDAESLPHARYGIPVGIVGAFVVAVFFLAIDWMAGRPLATPSALGATLFLGEPFDLSAPVRRVLVVGYTAMHGTMFIAIASMLTVALFSSYEPRSPSAGLWIVITSVAFLACEVFFVGFTLLAGAQLWQELGFVQITVANALAAAAMGAAFTGFVARAQRSAATRHPSLAARQHRGDPPAIHDQQHQSPTSGRATPGERTTETE